MLRRALLVLLALGGLLMTVEGTIIGYRYVWLDPEAPWVFRLMLPGFFLGLLAVLIVFAVVPALRGLRPPPRQ